MKKKPIRSGLLIGLLALIASCVSTQYATYQTGVNQGIKADSPSSVSADSIIAPYKRQLQAKMSVVIAKSAEILTKDTVESTLGNYVSDVLLQHTNAKNQVADLFISNTGGLRGIIPKGDVTIGDVYELLPFENELVVVNVTGRQMQELFRYMALRKNVCQSGMRIVLDKNGNLETGTINNKPFELNKTYKVLTSDYLANGGDNMSFLQGFNRKNLGIKLRDAFLDYFNQNKNTIIVSKKDKRVVVK